MGAYVFEIRNLNVENIVKFLGDSEIRHDLFCIFAECLVDLESGGSVRMRHFKVVFCELKLGEVDGMDRRTDRGR